MPLEELRPWQIKRIAEAEASEIQDAAQVERSLCKTKDSSPFFSSTCVPFAKNSGVCTPPSHRKAVRRALVAGLREIPKRESSDANHEPRVGFTLRSAYSFHRFPRSHRPLVAGRRSRPLVTGMSFMTEYSNPLCLRETFSSNPTSYG